MITIKTSIESFLSNIQRSQPRTTWKSYRSDLLGSTGFLASLSKPTANVATLDESQGADYIQSLLDAGAAPATRMRKAASLREYFRFAADEHNLSISVDRLNHKIKSRHLLAGAPAVIDFPMQKIERVLEFARKMEVSDLRGLRDQAFIWTLAETGLRVSEACSLKVGQIDRRWRATFIGKGGKQATISFGKNSRHLITVYLATRKKLDDSTGLTRALLPLFCRHDLTSGIAMVKPINPKTGEAIIHNLVTLALGDDYDPNITCHKLRHYFVTQILRGTGDIKAAKDLARHSSITTTDRYSHRDSEETAAISKDIFG